MEIETDMTLATEVGFGINYIPHAHQFISVLGY